MTKELNSTLLFSRRRVTISSERDNGRTGNDRFRNDTAEWQGGGRSVGQQQHQQKGRAKEFCAIFNFPMLSCVRCNQAGQRSLLFPRAWQRIRIFRASDTRSGNTLERDIIPGVNTTMDFQYLLLYCDSNFVTDDNYRKHERHTYTAFL